MLRKTRLSAALIFAFIALAGVLPAAENLDLKRITPVGPNEKIPAMDFFRPRLLQEPVLNPAGTHIAAIVTAGEDHHELLVYELKTQKIERVSGASNQDFSNVNWLNNRRLIFELTVDKLYNVGLFAAEVGSIADSYPLIQYYNSTLIAVPPKDRLRPLVWNRYDALERNGEQDLGVAVVNTDLRNGTVTNLFAADTDMAQIAATRERNERHLLKRYGSPGVGLTANYLANKDGQLEFCITVQNGQPILLRLVGARWEKCPVDLSVVDILECGDEPGQLVVRGPSQEGKPRAVQFMDGATGKLGEMLVQDNAYDLYGAGISDGWFYRDPITHHIIGVISDRSGPHAVWFSEEYRQLQKVLNGFFPGLVVRILGSDEAQNLFLVATFSDRQPVVYHWVDLPKRSAGLIKSSAPWIDPKRMQPMSVLKFKTRDGHALDAYLTLPAGASKTNPPPLVVLPHGGPWARDSWGFDAEVQFLANRGYAVLQPNYRGSNGYGWMFPDEDRWDFVKMHHDVTDAVKSLKASGLVDGERVAIMGASFGGYLAISGVVHEPSLYRCAVTIAGVFDWEQQLREKKYDRYDSWVFDYLLRRLGDPKQEREKFAAISPGRLVNQIRVPVFVSGGKDDKVVAIEQSRTLIAALEKNKVPHETYIVGGEGHGMRHLAKQVELYKQIEAFLAKHLAVKKP